MRKLFIVIAALSLGLHAGCAAGFHAGGDRTGIGADASIGHDPLLVTPAPLPR
jgi:hypothetical protein